MNFIENPNFIVLDRVFFHSLLSHLFIQPINYFNLFKIDGDTSSSSTRHIINLISLKCDLDCLKAVYQWPHSVPAGFDIAVKDSTTAEVDTDVPLRDLVDATHY